MYKKQQASSKFGNNGTNAIKQTMTKIQYDKELSHEQSKNITAASFKSKNKSKAMNLSVNESLSKRQHTAASGSMKIQAVPTLNLSSFKSRPMVPATSRNISHAATLVKKQTQGLSRASNISHRLDTKEADTDRAIE